DVLEEPFARGDTEIDDLVESVRRVVGIRNARPLGRSRIERPQETQLRSRGALFRDAEQILVVRLIHGEDVVEPVEILRFEVPGTSPDQDHTPLAGRDGACVGSVPDVPVARAGAVHFYL